MIRPILNTKLIFIIKIILIYSLFILKSYSDDGVILNKFVVLGQNQAPIKIKVFSSFTCPHCAVFHINVVPEINKAYVEAGKVQLIFVDFPLDQVAFNASKLVHCLDKSKQILFLDTIYETQYEWTSGSDVSNINQKLKKIVTKLGMDASQFDKCLANEAISDKILNGRIETHKKYSINSTPTVVINEKKLESPSTFKNIKKKIKKLI